MQWLPERGQSVLQRHPAALGWLEGGGPIGQRKCHGPAYNNIPEWLAVGCGRNDANRNQHFVNPLSGWVDHWGILKESNAVEVGDAAIFALQGLI